MKLSTLSAILTACAAVRVLAFPPAPYHEVYGMVRDEKGNPLSSKASVRLLANGGQIVQGSAIQGLAPGINYSLKVPMDAGRTSQLYQPTAMLPAMPFTAQVIIGESAFVPIQVQGGARMMGTASSRTRLDLTLGIDSDGDGLPDAWEQDVIDYDANDGVRGLADVNPQDDIDGDGVSNWVEYIAGTYAFYAGEAFKLEILEVVDGVTHLRFLEVAGRTYRIRSGDSLDSMSEALFSIHADGAEPAASLPATGSGVRYRDVYLKSSSPRKFFTLHVD